MNKKIINEHSLANESIAVMPENGMPYTTLAEHSVLEVTGTVNQSVRLQVNDGNFLDASGTAIPLLTLIPETGVNTGIYQLDFYHKSGVATTITVRMAGSAASDKSFTSSICTKAECPTIPTFSQWGLLIFFLLSLNLGIIAVFQKELILKTL